MLRRIHRGLTLLFCVAALCGCLLAQSETKTITIRMLDGKTGKPIEATGFLVRVDHEQTVHADWVKQSEDGTSKLTLPTSATLVSIRGTYDSSTEIFVNCDSASEKKNPVDRWYAISEIVSSGVVAPNSCRKLSEAAKLKSAVKPGEFVFMVRYVTAREQLRE